MAKNIQIPATSPSLGIASGGMIAGTAGLTGTGLTGSGLAGAGFGVQGHLNFGHLGGRILGVGTDFIDPITTPSYAVGV